MLWLLLLQEKRQEALGEFFGLYYGHYNVTGHRVWWRGHNIEAVLRDYGYLSEYRMMPLLARR
jgi:hypothetical protein